MSLKQYRRISIEWRRVIQVRRSSDGVGLVLWNTSNGLVLEDGPLGQAIATLEELDWCLEQLETMQTHKSVSDLALLKVRARFHFLMKFSSPVLLRLVQTNAQQRTFPFR